MPAVDEQGKELDVKVELETDEEEEEEAEDKHASQDSIATRTKLQSNDRSCESPSNPPQEQGVSTETPCVRIRSHDNSPAHPLEGKNNKEGQKTPENLQGKGQGANLPVQLSQPALLPSSHCQPGVRYKTYYKKENGLTVGYILPDPLLSSTATITAEAALPKTTLQTKSDDLKTVNVDNPQDSSPTIINVSQPQIQFKTVFSERKGKNVGYIVPVSSSSATDTKTRVHSTAKLKKVPAKIIGLATGEKVATKVPPRPRKPLQPTNCNGDLSKYKDFIHCYKCFSTFYKLSDLALHFDQCTRSYENLSFKNFKLIRIVKQAQAQNIGVNNIEILQNQTEKVNLDTNANDQVNLEMPLEMPLEITPELNQCDNQFSEDDDDTPDPGSKVTVSNSPSISSSKSKSVKKPKSGSKSNSGRKTKVKRSKPKPKSEPDDPDDPDRPGPEEGRRRTRKYTYIRRPRGPPKKQIPRADPDQVDRLGGGLKCIELSCSHLDFPSYTALIRHMRQVHGLGKREDKGQQGDQGKANHLCSECGEPFKTSFSLEVHMNRHRGYISRYICTFEGCNLRFQGRSLLRRHERKVHYPEQRIPCTVPGCPLTFVVNWDLRDHLNSAHLKVTPYKCRDPNCSLSFSTISDRYYHTRKDHHPKNFVCPVEKCDKAFVCAYYLKKHSRTHEGDRKTRSTFACQFPDCTAKLVSSDGLKNHIRIKHEGRRCRPKNNLCSSCGKAFCHQSSLEKHLETCSQEKPKKTPRLSKIRSVTQREPKRKEKAKEKSKVKEKQKQPKTKTSSRDTSLLCSFCGKAFAKAQSLKQHLTTHSEETHECSFCDKRFRLAKSLESHLNTHTGERPYKCRFCEKTYTGKSAAQKHEKAHSGFSPYQCKFCEDIFQETVVLKRHVIRKHKDCQFDIKDPPTYRIRRRPDADLNLEQDSSSLS